MEQGIKFFVGLDVHKDSIAVATAEAGRAPARLVGTIAHDVGKLRKLLARDGDPGQVQVVYEAGPTGYGLQRELAGRGYGCEVIAPSLIPVQTDTGWVCSARTGENATHSVASRLHAAMAMSVGQSPIATGREKGCPALGEKRRTLTRGRGCSRPCHSRSEWPPGHAHARNADAIPELGCGGVQPPYGPRRRRRHGPRRTRPGGPRPTRRARFRLR